MPGDFNDIRNDIHRDGCCDLDNLHYDIIYGNVDSHYVNRDIQHNRVRFHGYGRLRDGGFGDIDVLRGNNNCYKHCCINNLLHDGDSDPECYCVDHGVDLYCCRYDADYRHHDRSAHIHGLINSDWNHNRNRADHDDHRNRNSNGSDDDNSNGDGLVQCDDG